MKKITKYSILCSAILVASQWVGLGADEKAPVFGGGHLARKDALLVTITAKVEAIDKAKREMTLKGPLGNEETFVVDKRVKRFDEIKVGDNVQADYYVSIAAELRKPTPEEEKEPLTVVEAGAKAPGDKSPAAGGLRHFKAVTTIEGLDRPTQTVTVKGPMGRYHTVRVADPANLTKMRIGENIVVTYTEALAVSVEKVAKKASE
jgi:hypothetical protein